MNTQNKIYDAFNNFERKEVENQYKPTKKLFDVYSLTSGKKVNQTAFYGTIEQVEAYSKIIFNPLKFEVKEVKPIDSTRVNFLDNIDLDNLEFTKNNSLDCLYCCKYKGSVKFEFNIANDKAYIGNEFEHITNIHSVDVLKEFPDFIVFNDTI